MGSGAVAVIIPAKNESERIAKTIRAAKALPYVDLIVVVDDGSTDDTSEQARLAGASVTRHTVNRGKASSMETGAKVVAMREALGDEPRHLLFLDADLGDTAAEAAPLIEPVVAGETDCTIAVFPKLAGAGGHGFVKNAARKAIAEATGWRPQAPLSGQRCIRREAFDAVLPLAGGWGVETAMSIQLLVQGYRVQEVLCNMNHRVSRNDFRSQLHRLDQFIDVQKTIWKLRFQGVRLDAKSYAQVAKEQSDGAVYQVPRQ